MPQIVNLFLLVVGLLATGISLVAIHGNPILFVVTAMGVGLIIVAYISDQRRELREKEKQRTDIARRIAELTQTPWTSNQTLIIHGSVWMVVLLLLAGLAGAWAVYAGITATSTSWTLAMSGSFFLVLSAIALPRGLSGLGKPACELDRNGFITPIHRQIPWREVTGIHLQQYTYRGRTTSILLFRTDHYQRIVTDIHWTVRVLALIGLGAIRRGVVGVPLNDSKEKPETIYAVARFLWKQATGHDYEWNPMLSHTYNEAAKRMEDITVRRLDPEALKSQLSEHPEEALAELEQMSKDITTIRTERTRLISRFNWATGIAAILMLLSIFWPWLRRL